MPTPEDTRDRHSNDTSADEDDANSDEGGDQDEGSSTSSSKPDKPAAKKRRKKAPQGPGSRGAAHRKHYSIQFKLQVIDFYNRLVAAGTRNANDATALSYGLCKSQVRTSIYFFDLFVGM